MVREKQETGGAYRPIGKSVYGFLKNRSLQYGEQTALSFYGKKITFAQLFANIEKTAQALKALGVRENDVITVSLPAIPEAAYLFYAVNKIGAIYCALDCRSTSQEVEKTVRQMKPKACFVPCFQLKQFRCVSHIPVISVDMTTSIGGFTRFTAAFAEFFTGRAFLKRRHSNMMGFSRFLSRHAATEASDDGNFAGEHLLGYFYTSGTTYGRKCVVLTNENFNSAVMQHSAGCPDVKAGERMLNIMPLFTCYGLCLGLHLPLVLGMEVQLLPLFRGRNMGSLLTKMKPTSTATAPMLGALSTSVGKAACWTKIEICDPETGCKLPQGETGEICICGPTVCKGYLNDPENTAALLRRHSDGEIWLHSGDIGYLGERGEVFFCERIKRMYVRWDGTKVSPYAIEQTLLSCPVVKECLVYPVADQEHLHGCVAKAGIVLTTEKYRAREYLEKFIREHLGEHMRPEIIQIVKRLPLTKLGKVDYFAQEGKNAPKEVKQTK